MRRGRGRGRPTKTWKTTERQVAELFGGARVPLSGSNSKHGTTADVFKVPKFLYIEVKRIAGHNKLWLSTHKGLPIGVALYEALSDGWVASTVYNSQPLHLFRVDHFMTRWGYRVSIPDFHIKCNRFKRPFNLYIHTCIQAHKEKRDAVLLVYRVHGKHGLYAIADVYSIWRLEQWVRLRGRSILKRKKLRKPNQKSVPMIEQSKSQDDLGILVQ